MLLWLADALRAEGLVVHETNGWKTRGWGDPSSFVGDRGAMFHHTASPAGSGNAPSLGYVTTGSSIAPLCNILIGRNGEAWVVAAGKANHAGLGGPWRTVPLNAGNTYLVGVEVENNGIGEPWSETVLAACDRTFAAVLKRQGKDFSWCVGHKEYTTRKIDPSLNMDSYRARLRAYMDGGDEVAFIEYKQGWKFARDNPNRAEAPDGSDPDFIFGFTVRRFEERGLAEPAPVPGPAGPAGPAGPQGDKGDPGAAPSGTYPISGTVTI